MFQPTEGLDIQAEAYALVVDMIRTAAEKEKDSSYAGPKSALHTLSTCAGRFGPLLLRDADVILSSLGALRAHHMNKGMRDAAGAALKAVFSEVSELAEELKVLHILFSQCLFYILADQCVTL